MQPGKLNDFVKPLCWLLGTWKSIRNNETVNKSLLYEIKSKFKMSPSLSCKFSASSVSSQITDHITCMDHGQNKKNCSATVSYPTMKSPVDFCESLIFESFGQPLLNYRSTTWNPQDKSPMHLESGFLRIDKNGCNLSFLTAQNFGIVTLEEGYVSGNSICTESKSIANTIFVKAEVVAIHRCYSLNEKGQLVYKMKLQTPKTPLTDHLHCVYEKEDCKSKAD